VLRIVSAIVLLALVGSTVFLMPPWATLVLAAVAAAAAGSELAGLARALGGRVPALFAAAASSAGVIALAAPHFFPDRVTAEPLTALLLGATLAAGLLTLAYTPPGPAVFTGLSALLLAPAYVGLPLGTLAAIRAMCGPETMVWMIGVIAISDSAQYYTGRTFGRRKLAPAVSPGKTIEGLLGGLVVAPIAAALLAPWGLPDVPLYIAGLVGVILAAFGVAGDLFESLLKRSAGLKDSSTLIPGHGGVLDRIDAYLFAAPVFYLLLRFWK
jgi:phosphatidate cytidylyltransferase